MPSKSTRFQTVGQKYKDFTLIKTIDISELQCVYQELLHEPSGAKVLYIENDDPENLFCLSFQTIPSTSNGVAHILEHCVLCGSEQFPIKDPFFAMNRRSLNTFMNALTGADFTCYPAASQVPQDFYNLLEVYLDAVFHPKLNEFSFKQEGHRLEFVIPNDPQSPLHYKGIVYNEMKGALSSGSARLTEALNAALFPLITYGQNSGGDPKEIPQLTFKEMCEFYSTFYHRSRCLFFFYGNMPLEGHLDFLEKHALQNVKKMPPLPPIPLEPRFTEPHIHEKTYPISPEDDPQDKTMVALAWLTCHILEQEEVLALNVLEIILMDTDASPVKRALLKSGKCKQVSAFIDLEITEIPWGIILRGSNPEWAAELEEITREAMRNVCKEGIPSQMIVNALHQLELFRSEISGDQAPFGLSLFMRSGLLMQHGVPAEEGLRIHSLFDRLRNRILKEPNYLTQLIQKHFLDNAHFVRLVMKPDQNLGTEEAEEERKRLDIIRSSLTKKQEEEIIEQANQLAQFQKTQEDENLDILPKLTLEDISPEARDYPLRIEEMGNLKIFQHSVFTNGIIYADLVFDLPNLSEDELHYLRLLTIILNQMGCNGRNYEENLEYIQAHTGGIGAAISLNLQSANSHLCQPAFHIRCKALDRNASYLFNLLRETASSVMLQDIKRFKEILFKHYTTIESRLNQSALKYAINLSASGLNVPSLVANHLYGLSYYWKIREIVQNFDQEGQSTLDKLEELQSKVLLLDHPHLVISCNEDSYQSIKEKEFFGLTKIKTKPFEHWKGSYPLMPVPSQGRLIASPVAFIGKVFPTVSFEHPDAAALNIAAFLFDNLTLHSAIREKGGAYGGGAVSNPMSGNFYFYSYRDPHLLDTLRAFEQAVQVVCNGDFDDEDLLEAQMEMIQGLDTPISPGSRAEYAYGWYREGKNLGARQSFRNQILSVTCKEVSEAVKRHILPHFDLGATVAMAGRELLVKENELFEKEGKPPLPILSI